MAQYDFPVPDNLDDLLGLLNNANKLRLSLIHPDGTVQGYYASEYNTLQIEGNGTFQVANGNMDDAHVIFVADTPDQAAAFLFGCFFGTFRGKSLENIHDEFDPLREPI